MRPIKNLREYDYTYPRIWTPVGLRSMFMSVGTFLIALGLFMLAMWWIS